MPLISNTFRFYTQWQSASTVDHITFYVCIYLFSRNPLYLGVILAVFLLLKALWVQLDISGEFRNGAVNIRFEFLLFQFLCITSDLTDLPLKLEASVIFLISLFNSQCGKLYPNFFLYMCFRFLEFCHYPQNSFLLSQTIFDD